MPFGEQIVTEQEIIRPDNTTAYTERDVISNSASSTSLMAFNANYNKGGSGYITKVIVKTDNPLFLTQIRVWLTDDPTYAVAGDNSALNIDYTKPNLGYIDIPVMQAVGTACAVAQWTGTFAYKTGSKSNIYAFLQLITGTTTPVALQKFSVQLTLEAN